MGFSHAEVPLITEHSLYMNDPGGRRATVKEKQLDKASHGSLHGSGGSSDGNKRSKCSAAGPG